jgi:hypothetical protein
MYQVKFGTMPYINPTYANDDGEVFELPKNEVPKEMETSEKVFGFWKNQGQHVYLGIRPCAIPFSRPPDPWALLTDNYAVDGIEDLTFYRGKCIDGMIRILAVREGEERWK